METRTTEAASPAPAGVDRNARMLARAAELVAARGYRAVSMELVAKAAGVGKQTLYRRWPNKAAMFVDVYRWLAPAEQLRADDGGIELETLLRRLFAIFRTTPAGAILAGLVGDAAEDRRVRDAVRGGLVVDRDGLLDAPLARGAAGADVAFAKELVIALIWKRLLTDPAGLDDAFARELARRARAVVGPA
mgnify:FL=1